MAQSATFQALAFDGGPGGLLEVLVLKQIEAACPGFLKSTRLFAGTSAGSINALVLASVDDGATKLDALENFWQNIGPTFSNTPLGFLGAAFGLNALFNNKALIEHLSAPDLLGGLKISDLPKLACATAYNVRDKFGTVLSNLRRGFPGYDESCVDVAVSSGASPLVMPAHLGYIDGGVYANNPTRPAMSALYAALALDQTAQAATPGLSSHPELVALQSQVAQPEADPMTFRVLSVAGGHGDTSVGIGSDSWGYGRWLLDPGSFLRIVGIVLDATSQVGDVIAPVTKNLNYRRLDPNFVNKSFIPFLQADPRDLRAAAASPDTLRAVSGVVDWLREIAWVEGAGAGNLAARSVPASTLSPVVVSGGLSVPAMVDIANRSAALARPAPVPDAAAAPPEPQGPPPAGPEAPGPKGPARDRRRPT